MSDAAEQNETDRDVRDLYVDRRTLNCALNHCRPCCYKLIIYGKGLLPNQRPEQCPRSRSYLSTKKGLYDEPMRLLTIGDGDFSFSLALAKLVGPKVKLVATSHETFETVRTTYGPAYMDEILNGLKHDYNAKVLHGVDATSEESLNQLGKNAFDRIIWNFPCVRIPAGADGQNQEMEQNKELLAQFFRLAGALLKPKTGELHITHKTKGAFAHWKLEEIGAENGDWSCRHKIVFDRCNYPGYVNKKVLSNKSFPIWDSQTYIFTRSESPQTPEISEEKSGSRQPKNTLSSSFVPVTPEMLTTIRDLLLPSKNKRQTSKNTGQTLSSKKKRRKI
eukprot:CAMPEP_0172367928 /NCGR_PEP_ID=MMETSP1060-20121228/24677_1 /TAXON_ID=37318 /ORGANISM="Pseudo-nitzschia pungens, Strain cf. cingulata" /LENGTH=333 /DNA_ID=CAMNT_0013092355 /DNA_START=100 /DNA_END=1101 /DNA_ORIENTATION=+